MPYPRTEEGLVRHRTQTQKRRLKQRHDAFQKLGGVCVVCGFSDHRALQIDHVENDGYKEREWVKSDYEGYHRHIVEDAEGRYQLLCANCHAIKTYEHRLKKLEARVKVLEDTILNSTTHKVGE